MSIVSQASGAQSAAGWSDLLILLVLALLGGVSVVVAVRAGVFRRGSIMGPPRVGDREPLGMLVMVLGMAVLLLIMAQVTCMAPTREKGAASGPATVSATQPLPELSPGQMALLSSVPQMVAFGFMVLANRSIRPAGLGELGLTRGRIWTGVKSGLVGSVIVVPGVFLSAQLTEFLWRAVHYRHPAEHDLLRGLHESVNPLIGGVLIGSAVVVAPLFEETLFRGHLQTLLTYAWTRLRWRAAPGPVIGMGFEVIQPGGVLENLPPPPMPAPRPQPTAWMRWVSVVLTSVLFSLVHPAWSIPPIFVLSICLGYAYERTGNLWTVITMHAAFNSISTVLFLSLMR